MGAWEGQIHNSTPSKKFDYPILAFCWVEAIVHGLHSWQIYFCACESFGNEDERNEQGSLAAPLPDAHTN